VELDAERVGVWLDGGGEGAGGERRACAAGLRDGGFDSGFAVREEVEVRPSLKCAAPMRSFNGDDAVKLGFEVLQEQNSARINSPGTEDSQ
jgi:hypothetical protein